MSYTKLHQSILTSTVWLESDTTRIVWITMLAMADQHGEVQGSVPGLAHVARVSVEACREALEKFMAPDPESRTPDADGRRIEKIPGGWALLNHRQYRLMASKDDEREKTAARTRRWRDRKTVTHRHTPSQHRHGDATVTELGDIADTDTDSDTESKNHDSESSSSSVTVVTPPPPPPRRDPKGSRMTADWTPSAQGVAKAHGLNDRKALEKFRNYWLGVPGPKGRKLDWDATWRNFCAREASFPSSECRAAAPSERMSGVI